MRSRGIARQLRVLVAALVGVTLVAVGGLSFQLRRVSTEASRLAARSGARSAALFALVDAVGGVQNVAQRIIREKDAETLEKLLEQGKSLGQAADASIRNAGAERGVVADAWRALSAANNKAFETLLRGDYAQAQESFIQESNPAFANLLGAISTLHGAEQRAMAAEAEASSRTVGRTQVVVYVLVFGGIAALTGYALLLTRRIATSVREVAVALSHSADQMSGAAAQVSSSSQALAQGAAQQAASLEQTSTSAEESSAVTRQGADSARAIADLMSRTATVVDGANQRLAQMMDSMRGIGASSEKVSKIIKVIDEIAFQTNILALNAAVEAARAGQAGLGFAVVADEVRNLAQRCAQAARDTTALIEESLNQSRQGSERLDQVAEAIRSVTEGATQVKTLVDQVDRSSHEQARGIEQIARAIAQMKQVTQEAAASSEESAAAGEQLSAHSESLRGVARRLAVLAGAV